MSSGGSSARWGNAGSCWYISRCFGVICFVAAVTDVMDQTVFEIDGANFSDFGGFIAEFNRGFIQHVGGDWQGNLDAFND